MTDLVGAKAIARELGRLAGLEVSEWQVYRLAKSASSPIEVDRDQWKLRASATAIREWWETSRLAKRFAKRLYSQGAGRDSRAMAKTKRKPTTVLAKSAELNIIGVIGAEDLAAEPFMEALRGLGDVDVIRMSINSDGGIVSDGLAIYHTLRQHKARVEIDIIGVAASMASAIAMAGDRVRMAEDALFMLHDPWSSATGNADQLRAAAEMLDKFGESLAGIYARRTKFTEEQIIEMMGADNGDGTWLNAEEALSMGFIDEIIDPANARIPASTPVAAKAKRIVRGNGEPTMKFKDRIAALIAALVTGETTRSAVIRDLATAAEMSDADVEAVVKGEAFPTLPQLRAFAEVLDAKPKELRSLAEKEGHEFETDPPESDPADRPEGPRGQNRNRPVDVGAAVRDALEAERRRRVQLEETIRDEGQRLHVPDAEIATIINASSDVAGARERMVAWLAEHQAEIHSFPRAVRGGDERDKWIDGMTNWLVIKSGQRRLVEAHMRKISGQAQQTPLDAGEFRGFRLIDIARDCLERDGHSCRGMSPRQIARLAMSERARAEAGLGTRSDFPIMLENVLHKMLLAAYEIAEDKWRMVAATGAVQDFRDHPRLRIGALPSLSDLLETGEFKQLHFPDAEKEAIRAGTKGNIIGLSRQAVVNDDVDGFTRLVVMLGRAAARSIEIAVFNMFKLNNGLGPVLNDGNTVFHAAHNNIAATAGTPSQPLLEEGRVLMAQQKDPNGQDFLDLRPSVWVGPIGLGGDVRTAIQSQFFVGADGSAEFGRANIVRDSVSTIVDTPRLTGDRWYLLADPNEAPIFEVVFLEGEEAPVIEAEEGFDYDGVRWKVRHDWGVGATDFRGGVTNAGA